MSYTFGRDVVQDMLETLGISLVCRAHQVRSIDSTYMYMQLQYRVTSYYT